MKNPVVQHVCSNAIPHSPSFYTATDNIAIWSSILLFDVALDWHELQLATPAVLLSCGEGYQQMAAQKLHDHATCIDGTTFYTSYTCSLSLHHLPTPRMNTIMSSAKSSISSDQYVVLDDKYHFTQLLAHLFRLFHCIYHQSHFFFIPFWCLTLSLDGFFRWSSCLVVSLLGQVVRNLGIMSRDRSYPYV